MFGTGSHRRSGALELGNSRHSSGAEATYSYDWKGELTSSTKSTEQGKQATQTYKEGEQKYQEGKGTGETLLAAADAVTRPPVGERYSGLHWSPGALSDPSLAELAAVLDDAAAQSEATRAERESDVRKRSGSIAAAMALYVPYGTVAAAVLYVATEVGIAMSKLFAGETGDSQADRDRAKSAAKRLWESWLIFPPAYSPDIMSARTWAERIEFAQSALDRTEATEPKWQEEWRKTIALASESELPMFRDVRSVGWIPFTFDDWCGERIADNGRTTYLPDWAKHLKFGQCATRKTKPGFLSAARATETTLCMHDLGTLLQRTNKYAAGIAVALATRYRVQPEPVVEAAIASNRRHYEALGSGLAENQGWRMRAVFYDAWEAAGRSPKLPTRVVTTLNRQSLALRAGISKMSMVQPLMAAVLKTRLSPEAAIALLPELRARDLETRGMRELVRSWQTRRVAPK